MRLIFKSEHVHINTLVQHVLDRGYPTQYINLRNVDGCALGVNNRRSPFGRNGMRNNSDLYVFNNERPGLYLTRYSRHKNSKVRSFQESHRVHISLDLIPEIKFASLYPWTKVEAVGEREKVEWEVSVDCHGHFHSQVNEEIYHGHPSWELAINADAAHPSKSNYQTAYLFRRLFNPETSVVLSWTDIFLELQDHLQLDESWTFSSYLPVVLRKQLQLPVKIVLDFLNYFCTFKTRLDQQSDGNVFDIAIAFVSQKTMHEIAPLRITPKPVSTKRVFMLCGAVNTKVSIGPWKAWHNRRLDPKKATESKDWAKTIGPKRVSLGSPLSFRAIEWGVMLVPEEHLVGEA